jgi:hypothetical protein
MDKQQRWLLFAECEPWDTASPAGSFSYLWCWGIGQVDAFYDRVLYRLRLVDEGCGL